MSEDYVSGLGATGAAFGSFEMAAADAARATGDFSTALHWYESLLALDAAHLDARIGRCAVLRIMGSPRDSLADLIKILAQHPKHLTARLELALTLQRLGRGDEARSIYALLVREPGAPAEAWHGLALVLLAEGQELAAEIALRRSLALAPNRIEGRQQLADLLARRQDLTAATELYHDILAIAPDSAAAHTGLGQALIGLRRMDEARDQLDRALAIDPDNAVAHLGRARLHLLEGDLPAAWEDMEWRRRLGPGSHPAAPGKPWNGRDPLAGRSILLWTEQGIDDALQMLRYARVLAEQGAEVILGLPPPLVPLGAGVAGAARTIVSGQPLPPDIGVDYNASLSDMPRLLETAVTSIPNVPYITAPAGKRPGIAAPPGTVLKIGLAWGGARPAWSVPFPQIMTLLGHPRVAMFGLQMGPRAEDSVRMAHPALLHDLGATIADYADFAGRIAEMDLVVTVDGSVAHLAGAMGRKVWLMLPYAADWRWMQGRDDSPWYPSARLFRQERPGDWTGVLTQVMIALDELVADEYECRQAETRGRTGAKAAMQAFLSTHLQAGDLFVDIGTGDGGHALDAAAHPAGDIRVMAIDARQREIEMLADTVDISGLSEQVEVLCLALGDKSTPVVVSATSRAGRTVFPLPAWVRSTARTATLDELIGKRADLAAARLVVRIGAKGCESAIIAGMSEGLAAGSIAAVVFEHTEGATAAAALIAAGYRLYRFPGPVAGGQVVPFDGEPGIVLALAATTPVATAYGDAGAPTSPEAVSRAESEAALLAARGADELAAGRFNPAAALFTKALARNPDNIQANANLGALLRRIGRADAAAACWRRALKSGAGNAALLANLANVLRESGNFPASEAAFLQVLAEDPANPHFLYAFALLLRDLGRARESLATLEQARSLKPGILRPGDLATALLKAGHLARGMAEIGHRRPVPLSDHGAPPWDGGPLNGRTILIRDEGDAIDTVMLSRYVPLVASQGGSVVMECIPEAARLLAGIDGIGRVIPRGQPLPETDCTARLPDVPRLLDAGLRTAPPRVVPYLRLPAGLPVFRFPEDGRLRVGVAWSGRPTDRSPPLSSILRLAADPAVNLISLQRPPASDALVSSGGRSFFEDMGGRCTDLAETAAIIAGLDLVIAGDTAEAHIAGALGRPVWVLLPLGNDWRWVDGRDDSLWYPAMRVFRQGIDGSWDHAVQRIGVALGAMAAGKSGRRP